MTGAACLLCGATAAVHAHHVTGRPGPGLDYCDPRLVVPLCQRHHGGTEGVHVLLRTLGVEWPAPGRDLVAYRLHRLGLHAAVIGDDGHRLVLEPAATHGLAALALAGAASIDQAAEAGRTLDLPGTDRTSVHDAEGAA